MGWRVLMLVAVTGCVSPFERDGDIIDLAPDAGLRDGEMPAIVAQEWCSHWICEGQRGLVYRSCGGLDVYDCR